MNVDDRFDFGKWIEFLNETFNNDKVKIDKIQDRFHALCTGFISIEEFTKDVSKMVKGQARLRLIWTAYVMLRSVNSSLDEGAPVFANDDNENTLKH